MKRRPSKRDNFFCCRTIDEVRDEWYRRSGQVLSCQRIHVIITTALKKIMVEWHKKEE